MALEYKNVVQHRALWFVFFAKLSSRWPVIVLIGRSSNMLWGPVLLLLLY